MFVILTSKPGQFRTEAPPGVAPLEAWDYLFCGVPRARFIIAALKEETRVRVVDEAPPPAVSLVPTKFLPRFDSLEAARQELASLTRFGAGRHAALRAATLPA
jgi:hypothetical protein